MLNVIVADDSSLIRILLKDILAKHCNVLATVDDGGAAVLAVQELKPELILLDISMPILNGFEAARQIRHLCPSVLILFVSEHRETNYVQAAFDAGGSGYVLKSRVVPELLPAIQSVLAGREYGRVAQVS